MTSRSAPNTSPLRLVASVGAVWPQQVEALGAKQLKPEKLLNKLSSPKPWPCWLGYVNPIALLISSEPSDASALEQLLEIWLEHTAAFLKARQQAPERCQLINLSYLDAAALDRLLDDYIDDESSDETAMTAAIASPEPDCATLPLALQLYLQRRPDVLNRYADLEGQAELLGREPEFTLSLPRPDPNAWASLLLDSWQNSLKTEQLEASQQQLKHAQEEAELTLLQLHQVQEELEHQFLEHRKTSQERDTLQQQLSELQEQLSHTQAETETLRQQANNTEELEASQQQLKHAQEEAELTLLQLHQVQEELEFQFLEQRKASQERDALQEQLQSLRREMSYYFLLSHADPCLDQSHIPQLKALMRETLIQG